MDIENKLDEIISLLKEINIKLSNSDTVEKETKTIEIPPPSEPIKPTKHQLLMRDTTNLVNSLSRKSFLKMIKTDIINILEIQKNDPQYYRSFKPQSMRWIDENKHRNLPFYLNLRSEVEAFAEAVTEEGKRLVIKLAGQIKSAP